MCVITSNCMDELKLNSLRNTIAQTLYRTVLTIVHHFYHKSDHARENNGGTHIQTDDELYKQNENDKTDPREPGDIKF